MRIWPSWSYIYVIYVNGRNILRRLKIGSFRSSLEYSEDIGIGNAAVTADFPIAVLPSVVAV